MQIITNKAVVFNCGETIEKGRWENDPTMDTYKITKEDGRCEYCVIADFEVHEVASVPEDYEPNKYRYECGKFVLNPEWAVPEEVTDPFASNGE